MKELNGMMRDALDMGVAHAASDVVSNRVIDALRYQVRDIVWDEVHTLCSGRGSRVSLKLKEQAIEALDTLAYFHSLSCPGGASGCLGTEIEAMIADFTA